MSRAFVYIIAYLESIGSYEFVFKVVGICHNIRFNFRSKFNQSFVDFN